MRRVLGWCNDSGVAHVCMPQLSVAVWFGGYSYYGCVFFFCQAEAGIRDPLWYRGLGDVYKRLVVYAVWSGLGIVLVAFSGAIIYKEMPDIGSIIGMALIISGVVVMHLFSTSIKH